MSNYELPEYNGTEKYMRDIEAKLEDIFTDLPHVEFVYPETYNIPQPYGPGSPMGYVTYTPIVYAPSNYVTERYFTITTQTLPPVLDNVNVAFPVSVSDTCDPFRLVHTF